VVRAVDCGTVVHPGIVTQQMQGAIVFGLSAALYGGVRFEANAVRDAIRRSTRTAPRGRAVDRSAPCVQ
jgi:CO/xanthine dehydrogenase Mo-binding subunit